MRRNVEGAVHGHAGLSVYTRVDEVIIIIDFPMMGNTFSIGARTLIRIEPTELGLALSGFSHVKCEYTIGGEPIGQEHKWLPGKMDIGRYCGNRGDGYRLELEDVSSGLLVLEGDSSDMSSLATLFVLHHSVEFELDMFKNSFQYFGMVRETKEVWVPYDSSASTYSKPDQFREEMEELAKPYEVDGWEYSAFDRSFNQHRYNHKSHAYKIMLIRFVEAKKDGGSQAHSGEERQEG